jgi:beta-lactamase superfamily II metal-dependent hydrolase
MKLRIFQSDNGDCLLLTGADGRNMLIDGGMRSAFKTHVLPHLGRLREAGEQLDLVCVSHIDEDHIAGVLELLDTEIAWRVHDFRQSKTRPTKAPAAPRPPPVGGIWHNAFGALLDRDAGDVGDLFAQSSRTLALSADAGWRDLAATHHDLGLSVDEAIRLSLRIGDEQLKIPLNAEFGKRLILTREPAGVDASLGGMQIRVLGPFAADVQRLKKDWDDWLAAHAERVAKLQETARKDAEQLRTSVAAGEVSQLDLLLSGLGNRSAVTPPNLASVLLLVEEGNKRVLLTGDGHADDILAGLEHHGVLPADGTTRVDVLKVQHHGSKNNVHEAFFRRVLARHYVFCGNGEYGNPHLDVLKLLLQTNQALRPDERYDVWFSSNADAAPAGKPREQMQAAQQLIQTEQARPGSRMTAHFLDQSSVDFDV